MSSEERCVCCGEIIPEGGQVCQNCRERTNAKCILKGNCPCETGACQIPPDEGCPVYRYFKRLILSRQTGRKK